MSRKAVSSFAGATAPKVPKLTHHKGSGRAVVRLNKKDCYCGDWGTHAAKAEYDRLISLWLANGRRLDSDNADLRIAELVKRYIAFAKGFYKTEGGTGELEPTRQALDPLVNWYGRERASEFGPLKLKALRERWIGEGRVRSQINAAMRRVVRCFKWGVENEMLPGEVLYALRSVPGLKHGRSGAKESEPVRPADDAVVEAALPYMPPPVRAMVQLQRHSGMRPGEVVQLAPSMVDQTNDVWVFRVGGKAASTER